MKIGQDIRLILLNVIVGLSLDHQEYMHQTVISLKRKIFLGGQMLTQIQIIILGQAPKAGSQATHPGQMFSFMSLITIDGKWGLRIRPTVILHHREGRILPYYRIPVTVTRVNSKTLSGVNMVITIWQVQQNGGKTSCHISRITDHKP